MTTPVRLLALSFALSLFGSNSPEKAPPCDVMAAAIVGDHAAFLAAIRANPEDDTARLAYADWLDEHNDPEQAEFFRLQVQLEHVPEHDMEVMRLETREKVLLARNRHKWLPPALAALTKDNGDRFPLRFEFRRGLPETVHVYSELDLIPHLETLVKEGSVRRLAVSQVLDLAAIEAAPYGKEFLRQLTSLSFGELFRAEADDVAAIAHCESLKNLTRLHIEKGNLGTSGAQHLANSPHLKKLERLSIRNAHLGADGARILLESDFVEKLDYLNLSGNGDLSGAMSTLAGSPRLRNLTFLALNDSNLSAKALRSLAQSPNLAKVEMLHLNGNEMGVEGIKALASSPHLAQLRSLHLNDCALGDRGVQTLSQSPTFRGVKYLTLSRNGITIDALGAKGLTHGSAPTFAALDLSRNDLGGQGLTDFFSSPKLANLEYLNLGRNNLDPSDAKAVADSPHLKKLDQLDLNYNHDLGKEAVKHLVASKSLAHLRVLELSQTEMDKDAMALLAGSPTFSRLEVLGLSSNPIGNEGIAAIARSPHLGRLKNLFIGDTNSGREGLLHIARSTHLPQLIDIGHSKRDLKDYGSTVEKEVTEFFRRNGVEPPEDW